MSWSWNALGRSIVVPYRYPPACCVIFSKKYGEYGDGIDPDIEEAPNAIIPEPEPFPFDFQLRSEKHRQQTHDGLIRPFFLLHVFAFLLLWVKFMSHTKTHRRHL